METGASAPESVEAALQRITASQTFARAARATGLLRYVVEKAAHGRAGEIKEYTIALEVFERAGYDPKIDSLVRVEAGKLRELLAKYYEAEGRDDPVRIEIPTGRYAPVFHEVQPVQVKGRGLARRRVNILAAAAVLGVVLAAVAWWRWGMPARLPPPSKPLPIAVLPFVDMTPSKDQQSLCDGLTEELIDALAGMEGLRVAARTSVFQYKGKEKDVRRIGEDLKVQAVIEGSVRKEGARIRVAVQFINAEDGFHLWSETYDGDFPSNIEMEREITDRVSRSFRNQLHPVQRALVRQRPQNQEAWQYYLRGAYNQGHSEPSKAVEFFRMTTRADPGYAPAWAGLANALVVTADWREVRPADVLPQAAQAARRAVEIDPSLAEAQQAAGRVKFFYERDWAGAERAFRRAIELDPAHWESRLDYARLLTTSRRRFRDAIDQLERAMAIDPTKSFLRDTLAGAYIKAREYDQAIPHLEASLRMVRVSPAPHVHYGLIAMGKRDYAEALRRFEEAAAIRHSTWILGFVGAAQARLGRREEAQTVIAELEGLSGKVAADYEIAVVETSLGERDRAFERLERAYAELSPAMLWLNVDLTLDDLHGDPRFTALLKKMRLE